MPRYGLIILSALTLLTGSIRSDDAILSSAVTKDINTGQQSSQASHNTVSSSMSDSAAMAAAGFTLFRMSKVHGNLSCDSCHINKAVKYTGSMDNNNLRSLKLHENMTRVVSCTNCHDTTPLTANRGPHGSHTTGQVWVKAHLDYSIGREGECAYCHGTDLRGGPQATIRADITFITGDDTTHSYKAGDTVSCYDCHSDPLRTDPLRTDPLKKNRSKSELAQVD